MTDRLNQILAIARNNALVGLDQNDVNGYEDNMRDSIATQFPDCTSREIEHAEFEFARIIKKQPAK